MGILTNYIEKEKIKQRRKNIEELRGKVNHHDEEISQKIVDYIERYGLLYSEDYVKQMIIQNDLVASIFIKEPNKQNFTEKIIANMLNTKTLPQSGPNCVRFNSNGDIETKKGLGITKAADFFINNVYYTQKYTMSSGGAQDNQKQDVIDFLSKGSKKYNVGAILDGDYWDLYRNELKEYFKDNDYVIITSIEEMLNGQ